MKKGIAFFDSDGTITTKDSLAEIIRLLHGDRKFFLGIVKCLPMIIGFKLGLLDRQRSKEYLLSHFFGGRKLHEFEIICASFTELIIPDIIRKGALEKLQWHREQGHEIVLVSASPQNWLQEWCAQQQIACIATILEHKNGMLTGKTNGKNCHGQEKVDRIKQLYDLSQYQEIYAYGDTSGDLPMLALANHKHYKPFR